MLYYLGKLKVIQILLETVIQPLTYRDQVRFSWNWNELQCSLYPNILKPTKQLALNEDLDRIMMIQLSIYLKKKKA